MENNLYDICGFCRTEISSGSAVTVCPVCGVKHHAVCWETNGGCASPGCRSAIPSGAPGSPAVNTAAPAVNPAPPTSQPQGGSCLKCGMPLAPGQPFCQNCGSAAAEAALPASPVVPVTAAETAPQKKKSKAPVIIGICAGAAAAVLVIVIVIVLLLPKKAKSISIRDSEITVTAGDTYTLKYDIKPDRASDEKVTWTSDNELIAAVENGVVTGKFQGTCTITATTESGKTDTCRVTVEMSKEDMAAVGVRKVIKINDLDGSDVTDSSSYGWKLYLNDDNSGKLYYGGDEPLTFLWTYSYTDDDGDYYYVTSDEDIYFFYIVDYDQIWLFLKGDDLNWCLTCE